MSPRTYSEENVTFDSGVTTVTTKQVDAARRVVRKLAEHDAEFLLDSLGIGDPLGVVISNAVYRVPPPSRRTSTPVHP